MSIHNLTVAERKGAGRQAAVPAKSFDHHTAWHGEYVQSVPDENILHDIAAAMRRAGYTQHDILAVRLSVEEALVNAYSHGNGRDTTKCIKVCCKVSRRRVRAQIEDEGQGFDPESVPDPSLPENLDKIHGRGLALMRKFMTQVRFNRRGNKVTLSKNRAQA